MGRIKNDLTGKIFPHFEVIEPVYLTNSKGEKSLNWKCKCECGNVFVAQYHPIITGEKISCGCIRRPRRKEEKKRKTHPVLVVGKIGNKTPRNKSGHVGVCWIERDQKWIAYLTFCGKHYWLGAYATKEEAAAARIAGEKQLRIELEQVKKEIFENSNILYEESKTLYEKLIAEHTFLKDFPEKPKNLRKSWEKFR